MPDPTEDSIPADEAPDPGVTRHFGEAGGGAAPEAGEERDPESTNVIPSEAVRGSAPAKDEGEAVDTGDLDAEDLVLEPDSGEPGASTKMFAVQEAAAEPDAPSDPARDDPTTIIGSDEIQLDEPSLGEEAPGAPGEENLDPTTMHDRDAVEAAGAGEERTTIHEREEVEQDLGATVVAGDEPELEPKRPPEPIVPAKPDYVPLEGEADEIALDQPFSLRPSGAMQIALAEGMTTSSDLNGPSKLLWIAAGSVLGIAAFAAFFFSPVADAGGAFVLPAPEEPVALTLPAGISVSRWERRGSYYWGLEPASPDAPARAHLYDPAGAADAAYRGAADAGAQPAEPSAPSLVGAPQFDGLLAAWFDAGSVVWNSIAGAEAPGGKGIAGRALLGAGIDPVYAPVRIEEWNRARTERFAIVGRGDATSDQLIAVDPLTERLQRLDLGAGRDDVHALAPPVPLYQPATGRALLLVATTRGPALIDATGDALERAGGGPRYLKNLDRSDWSTIRRIRLGRGDVGWIIAHSHGYAVIRAVTGDAGSLTGLELVHESDEGDLDAGSDRARAKPWVVTFPNSERPELDDAVILLGPEVDADGIPRGGGGVSIGFWVSDPGSASGKPAEFAGPGSQPAAADFNGDGFWDLAGIEVNGRLWIVDGAAKQVVENLDAGTGPRPAGPISWRRRPEGMEAFYFTSDGAPARWLLPVRTSGDGGLDGRLAADWDWRIGLGSVTDPN